MSVWDDVKEHIDLRDYAAQYLEKSVGGLYCCPICNSGKSGKRDSDGALGIFANGKKWKCQSCQARGDIYDLIGIRHNTTDTNEQLMIAAEFAGISIERRGETMMANDTKASGKTSTAAGQPREEKKGTDTPKNDYTVGRERHRRYVAECARRLKEQPTDEIISYLTARGITYDEAVTLGLGYDPNYKDKGKTRLIIPWAGCDYYHIDRALVDVKSGKYQKPPSEPDERRGVTADMCVGAQPLYNPQAFDHDYIVIVEGALDAIAIQLCGYNAIAAGGVNVEPIANEAAARNYSGVIIDMLDADGEADERNKGRFAGKKLVSLMANAGITCLSREEYGIGEGDTYNGYKDAGEWFAANRGEFSQVLEFIKLKAREKAQEAKDAEYREAMKHLNVKNPARVADDLLELRDVYAPVPTGIAPLDDVLGGGVNLGETTFFGAISSYGKTSLAVQIADYMAAAGRSVLFVTIEQSAKELISKSLSRLMYLEGDDYGNKHITTPSEIMSLKERNAWGMLETDKLKRAVNLYSDTVAPNMRILEGNKQPTVSDIRAIATVMKEHDGQAPIIFIDYLQLLAARSERDTDKQAADYNVSELRKMARDLVTHVWCISSLNRSSYSGAISLDSFKESGGIEYGADNLLGLQPRGMEERLSDVAETKMKRTAEKIIKTNKAKKERDCELVVLKQRNGALPNEPLPLVFKPMAAYFTESKIKKETAYDDML